MVYGLAKLGVQFSESPPRIQSGLVEALLSILIHMNEQEVANVVYS